MDGVGFIADSGIIALEVGVDAGSAVSGVSGSVSVLPATAALGYDDVTSVSSGAVLPSAVFRNPTTSALFRKLRCQIDPSSDSSGATSGTG